MNNVELMQQCLDAAKAIVAAEKELYSGVDAQAFDVSVEGGSTSSEFQRRGTSSQEKQYQLPSNLGSLIEQTYLNSGVPASLNTSEQAFLSQMLSLVPTLLPNLSALTTNAALDPTSFVGSGTLSTIAGRNPYSSDWETNTQQAYDRAFGQARAATMSGPENVRGGQARAGFELADTNTQMSQGRFREVNQQQQQESGVVGEAIKTAAAIESARRGIAIGAQGQQAGQETARMGQKFGASDVLGRLRGNTLASSAVGAEFMSRPKVTTTDNLQGQGNQSHLNWGAGAGLNCCWILNAAHGGELPWWVRFCRDRLGTEETRKGYKRMAKWLVPWMARVPLVRWLVVAVMLHPLTEYGGWICQVPGREGGFVFAPVKRFWFAVWNKLGKA